MLGILDQSFPMLCLLQGRHEVVDFRLEESQAFGVGTQDVEVWDMLSAAITTLPYLGNLKLGARA